MSTNKKFRIQNGADIHGGGLSIDDVVVIGADGKVVPAAIADAVAGLTSSDIADLQAQVSAILGTSPETLDTLQEIVAAFENADGTLTGSVAQNAADIATINTTLTNGVATPTDVADLQSQVTSNDTDIAANAAAIAAANARTSGISTSSGSSNIQMAAEVDMDSNKVTNMADPTAAQDAATKAYVDAASSTSSSDLATETAARIAGDATVQASVDVVSGRVDAILNGAGESLDTIVELVAAFEDADSDLQAVITANSTGLSAEVTRATTAEGVLQSNIDALTSSTGTDLSTETAARIAGDSDLTAALAAETSARTLADTEEATQRNAADAALQNELQGKIDDEEAARILADSEEATQRNAADAALASDIISSTTLVAGDGISVDNLTHTVALDGSAISQNLVPSDDNMYTLGSPDKVWKDVYIGPGSLYIGGQKVIEDNSGTITINADPDQNMTVQTTGTGGLNVQSTGSGGISIDAASESVQVKSDMVVSVGKTISTVGGAATKFGGDIDMQTNTVSGLGAPSMDADAATKLYVDDRIAEATISGGKTFADDVIISGNLTVSGTTTTVNSETISLADNIIDLNSNLTSGSPSENAGIRIMRGDASAVQLRWNETSDHWETYNGSAWTKIALDTDDLAEGSTNKYFTDARAKACLTGGLCITYNTTTGEIAVDEAEAESSLRVAESVASDDADKLDGQEGTYYRINVYNVAGTLVN
jgi:hypothetical protein